MSIAQESSSGSIDTGNVGAWKASRDSAHCQSPGIITADVNSYERQTVDNIYSCSGEKGRRDFCFEHGTLLFRTRGGVVFFRRTPFRLFVPRFCSPGQLIPSFSSLLTYPLPSWRFSPGEINGRVSSQRPLQSNRGLFRESQEGRDSQGARN